MLETLKAPELVIGLCSPIGTENSKATDLLRASLLRFGYTSNPFKVTTLMKSVVLSDHQLVEAPAESRYDSYIKYANEIRRLFDHPGVLSMLCCAAIRAHRRTKKTKADSYLPSNAYIFDQFKRPEEIEVLRQTYGRLFSLISIYSSKSKRHQNLLRRIAKDHAVSRASIEHDGAVSSLIKRDEEEEQDVNGQRIRDVFPMADVFIDIDHEDSAKVTLERYLDALFGSNIISPTRDEHGMYIAKSASLRSLDLSRQVGAAIFSRQDEILSIGCNDVPKSGGGQYWCDDPNETRDYTWGHDENESIKQSILADLIWRLSNSELIHIEKEPESLVSAVLEASRLKGHPLRESQLMDLLEFGRNIHAEMAAITDAARTGRALRDSKMYCTTFPCHMCAKHIVASGISCVKYIEPFPKSYAEQLHTDSITLDRVEGGAEKVSFEPFIGIAPFRYRDLFERRRRKEDNGSVKKWQNGVPHPVVPYTLATYLQNEAAFIKIFDKKAEELIAGGGISVRPRDSGADQNEAAPTSLEAVAEVGASQTLVQDEALNEAVRQAQSAELP